MLCFLQINYLTYIGGNKTGPITRRILERMFDNNLATKCNWTGKNNKIGLKDLQLIKVIIGKLSLYIFFFMRVTK